MELQKREIVNNDLDLPTPGPEEMLKEQERRRTAALNPGIKTTLTVEEMAAMKAEFQASNGGFWIVNCANRDMSTKCDVANVRFLAWAKTSEEADVQVLRFMRDPRVTSVPIKIPADIPFQIPLSEASAMHPEHTLSKIGRNMMRNVKFREEQAAEFEENVKEGRVGKTKRSLYFVQKEYLRRQKEKLQPRDGLLHLPEDMRVEVETPAVSVPTAPQAPIWKEETLPEHWLTAERDASSEWPRDLEMRRGRFVIISIVFDFDKAEDSPAFPDAAGREPIVIAFGGVYEKEEDATETMKNQICPWCPELPLYVVDMYEWLWPTEIDPDELTEHHRTEFEGYQEELNTIMSAKKKQNNMASALRSKTSGGAAALPTIEVTADLPDIGTIATSRREKMKTFEVESIDE